METNETSELKVNISKLDVENENLKTQESDLNKLINLIEYNVVNDENYKLSVDEAKLLGWNFMRTVADDGFNDNEEINFSDSEINIAKIREKTSQLAIDKIKPTSRWEKIKEAYKSDTDIEYSLINYDILMPALLKMNIEDRLQVSNFLVDHIYDYTKISSDMYIDSAYTSLILKGLNPSAEGVTEVGKKLITYAENAFEQLDKELNKEIPTLPLPNISYVARELTNWGNEWIILYTLAKEKDKKLDMFTGRLIREYGVVGILNKVKSMIKENPQEKEIIHDFLYYLAGQPQPSKEFAGHKGIKKVVIPSDLAEFYMNLVFSNEEEGFQNYLLSEEAKTKRPKFYEQIFEKYGVNSGDSVIDSACGSGWLTYELRKKGYNIRGFDQSDELLKIARSKYAEVYDHGSLTEIDKLYGKNTQKAVLLEGRTARHFDTSDNFINFARKVHGVLEDDGLLIFDLPDPFKGNQRDRLKEYRDALQKFGLSQEYLEEDMWQMIGGPPGQKGETEYLINSWIPPEVMVRSLLKESGYEVLEVVREDNYDHRGSENVTYIARKTKREEMERKKKQ